LRKLIVQTFAEPKHRSSAGRINKPGGRMKKIHQSP
jgi:hypothetical protein